MGLMSPISCRLDRPSPSELWSHAVRDRGDHRFEAFRRRNEALVPGQRSLRCAPLSLQFQTCYDCEVT